MLVYWICFFIDHYNEPNICKVDSEVVSEFESEFESDLDFESNLEKQTTVKPDVFKQDTFDSRLDYFLYDEETGFTYKI
jgi:hypothetical protein